DARHAQLVRAGHRRGEHRQWFRRGRAGRSHPEDAMTTLGYFDCFSGIAGDMCLGALVDAGVPFEALEQPLRKLQIQGFELEATRVERLGIRATAVRVRGENAGTFRNYFSVRSMIENPELPDPAR